MNKKDLTFPDQEIIDEFIDALDDPELNHKMMNNYLAPLLTYVKQSKDLNKMKSNYHKLLNQFKNAKYYNRFTMMTFISILHGYNSMTIEFNQPEIEIKNINTYSEFLMKDTENIKLSDLLYALNLTPKKAVEYFKSKGIVISENWMETLKNSRQHSFTISKIMNMDILTDFKSLLEKAIEEGMSAYDFKKQIKELLAQKGWLGHKISDKKGQEFIDSPWRLNLVYRQNIQTAYNQGRWDQVNETKTTRPYIQFISTIDKVTTKECKSLHLKILKITDKKIKYFLPPGHYNCRRRFRSLSEFFIKKKGLNIVVGSSIINLKNQKGFEFNGIGKYKPDYSKYPPEIINELKKGD